MFESGERKLPIQKYPGMCGQGLKLAFFSLLIARGTKIRLVGIEKL